MDGKVNKVASRAKIRLRGRAIRVRASRAREDIGPSGMVSLIRCIKRYVFNHRQSCYNLLTIISIHRLMWIKNFT